MAALLYKLIWKFIIWQNLLKIIDYILNDRSFNVELGRIAKEGEHCRAHPTHQHTLPACEVGLVCRVGVNQHPTTPGTCIKKGKLSICLMIVSNN